MSRRQARERLWRRHTCERLWRRVGKTYTASGELRRHASTLKRGRTSCAKLICKCKRSDCLLGNCLWSLGPGSAAGQSGRLRPARRHSPLTRKWQTTLSRKLLLQKHCCSLRACWSSLLVSCLLQRQCCCSSLRITQGTASRLRRLPQHSSRGGL